MATPLEVLLELNGRVQQASEAEIIFNNIIVGDRSAGERTRTESQPFFDMSMEDKYATLEPEYYRGPVTVAESLLVANFFQQYQRQLRLSAERARRNIEYKHSKGQPATKRRPDDKPDGAKKADDDPRSSEARADALRPQAKLSGKDAGPSRSARRQSRNFE